MAKTLNYLIGDCVTLPKDRPPHWNKKGLMDGYLGKTVRIQSIGDIFFTGKQTPSTSFSFDGSGYYRFLFGDLKYKSKKMTTQQKAAAILGAANKLLRANNTITTLEIKNELIKTLPHAGYWKQAEVSQVMADEALNGTFTYTDNGTFRVYSYANAKVRRTRTPVAKTPIPTKKKLVKKVAAPVINNVAKATAPVAYTGTKISKLQALKLMQNNKGHFFTSVFVEKDGTIRTMSAQYYKDQKNAALGYVTVRDASLMKKTPSDCIRTINLQTLKQLRIAGQQYKL